MSEEQVSYTVDLDRNSGQVTMGTHNFVVREYFTGSTPNGGPYWGFRCECSDPTGEDRGKPMTAFLFLSQQARFKLDEFLDAIGAPKKGKSTGEAFVGKSFRATVTAKGGKTGEEYEPQFGKYLPAGEAASSTPKADAKSDSSKVPGKAVNSPF